MSTTIKRHIPYSTHNFNILRALMRTCEAVYSVGIDEVVTITLPTRHIKQATKLLAMLKA